MTRTSRANSACDTASGKATPSESVRHDRIQDIHDTWKSRTAVATHDVQVADINPALRHAVRTWLQTDDETGEVRQLVMRPWSGTIPPTCTSLPGAGRSWPRRGGASRGFHCRTGQLAQLGRWAVRSAPAGRPHMSVSAPHRLRRRPDRANRCALRAAPWPWPSESPHCLLGEGFRLAGWRSGGGATSSGAHPVGLASGPASSGSSYRSRGAGIGPSGTVVDIPCIRRSHITSMISSTPSAPRGSNHW